MKLRAFGRMPQWVRLSEWLGLFDAIPEILSLAELWFAPISDG
jgi:hypothetical protein